MDETARWLLTNFQQVTVAGILAFALIALYREWIVLGKTYRECKDDKAELETEVKRYLTASEQETAELRQELAVLRQSRRRAQ